MANMAASEALNAELENTRYEEAFGLIKYVFGIDELFEDQLRLIKAFVNGQNIFFSAPTGYGKSIVYPLPWVFDILND